MGKSDVLQIRLDPELKRLIESAATTDGRRISDWARRVLEAAAKALK
jgi:uncharacterized protein (DUF1778 family)